MTSIKSPSLPSISDDTPSIYFTFPFNFTFFLFFGVNREKKRGIHHGCCLKALWLALGRENVVYIFIYILSASNILQGR